MADGRGFIPPRGTPTGKAPARLVGEDASGVQAAMEKTPPVAPKVKPARPSPRLPATKAEHAAFKRSNKTAFKPAPRKS